MTGGAPPSRVSPALFGDPAGCGVDFDLAAIEAAIEELPSVAGLWEGLEPEGRTAWACTWRELMGGLDEAGRVLFGGQAPIRRQAEYGRVLRALADVGPLVDALGLCRPRALVR